MKSPWRKYVPTAWNNAFHLFIMRLIADWLYEMYSQRDQHVQRSRSNMESVYKCFKYTSIEWKINIVTKLWKGNSWGKFQHFMCGLIDSFHLWNYWKLLFQCLKLQVVEHFSWMLSNIQNNNGPLLAA